MQESDKNPTPFQSVGDRAYVGKLQRIDTALNKLIDEIIDAQDGENNLLERLDAISALKPVVLKSENSFILDPADSGKYIRATFDGAKSLIINPQATTAQPDGASYTISNRNNGAMTITSGEGVTINKLPSTSYDVPKDGTVLIKKAANNNYDLTVLDGGSSGGDSDLNVDVTSTGFTMSALSADAEGGARNYSLTVERSSGTAYDANVSVKSIAVDDAEEFFNIELAKKSDIANVGIFDISDLTFDLESYFAGALVRVLSVGGKFMTIQSEAEIPQTQGARFFISNRAPTDLVILVDPAVTVRYPETNGSLRIAQNAMVMITRISENNFDLTWYGADYLYGIGGEAVGLSSDSQVNLANSRASGIYSANIGYDTGVFGTLPTTSPFLHMDRSANYASQLMSFLPSNNIDKDGRLIYRDRHGAVWNPWCEMMTTNNTPNLEAAPVYDELNIVNGLSIRLRVWKGIGKHGKDAHLIASFHGTVGSAITENASFSDLPSELRIDLFDADNNGYVTMPIFAGGFGTLKTNVGSFDINMFGNVRFSIFASVPFGDQVDIHLRYKTK